VVGQWEDGGSVNKRGETGKRGVATLEVRRSIERKAKELKFYDRRLLSQFLEGTNWNIADRHEYIGVFH
jgi:hypothetical protein